MKVWIVFIPGDESTWGVYSNYPAAKIALSNFCDPDAEGNDIFIEEWEVRGI